MLMIVIVGTDVLECTYSYLHITIVLVNLHMLEEDKALYLNAIILVLKYEYLSSAASALLVTSQILS
jgi:hypothetical protein